MTQTVLFEGAKYFNMTLLVDVKIRLKLNEIKLIKLFPKSVTYSLMLD